MSFTLGERDDRRFAAVDPQERRYLAFQIDLCLQILQRRPSQIEALQSGAEALTALGYFRDGLELDQRLASLRPKDPTVLYNLACSQALTGLAEEAIDTLEAAYAHGYRDIRHIARDPDLETLRPLHRFQKFLVRIRDEPSGL